MSTARILDQFVQFDHPSDRPSRFFEPYRLAVEPVDVLPVGYQDLSSVELAFSSLTDQFLSSEN